MPTRITVPHLDANTVDVTVTAWRKAPGDRVQAGEIVAELTTDKATFELESTGSGTLLEILAAPKSVVPAGYILALLGEPSEVDAEAAAYNDRLMEKYRAASGKNSSGQNSGVGIQNSEFRIQNAKAESRSPSTLDPRHAPASTPRIRATPRARRLAQEHGIDLARVHTETGADVIDEAVLQVYLKKLPGKP